MKSNCTSYSSCLQWVSRAKRLVSDSCCARRLTQLAGDRDKLFSVQSVSQSVNASFTWDLTIQSVLFWIVFLTQHKVFDILSVLVDTHRTRFDAARLPINRTRSLDFLQQYVDTSTFWALVTSLSDRYLDWKNLCVNKILFNVVYSQSNVLFMAKLVIFCVLWFPKVR